MTETKRKKPFHHKVREWFKKHYLPLLGLLATIGIIVAVTIIYLNNRDIFKDLEKYGYAGVFVISVLLNATIIIPVSAMAVISSMGGVLQSPLLVGLIGGIGAGIGEMTAFVAGRSGRGLVSKGNMYNRVEKWVKRWGWIAIFFLSIFPLIFDIAGIIAGAMRMPAWKFFLATWLGRTISYIVVAYLGTFIFSWLG
jgi:uncharacterized membrane protein YdjX (TVP38/TMEM64 family)